ncbi:MAG: glycosyltransferase family 2 protein [Epulopiscium sp.]|nr:glycosyltransferase family 2 protein [Candidatus Epulonipiscium sp.]
MQKISIIIPCFNSFKMMDKCFNSLLKQTYKNFEIIIVDDSSTDDSYKSLKKYAKISPLDIKLLKTDKNSGPGPSRNLALENVEGDYITFLDSDDWIESNCLEKLIDIFKKDSEIDGIFFDYYMEKEGKSVYKNMVQHNITGTISKRDALIFSKGSTWGKIYKAKIIRENGIRFPDIRRNEDMPFNKIATSKCEKIYYLKEGLYHYIIHKKSLMHNKTYHTEENAIKAFEVIYKELSEKYPFEVEAIFILQLLYATVLRMAMLSKSNAEIKAHIDKYEELYPNWEDNEIIKLYSKHVKIVLFLIKHKCIYTIKIIGRLRKLIERR